MVVDGHQAEPEVEQKNKTLRGLSSGLTMFKLFAACLEFSLWSRFILKFPPQLSVLHLLEDVVGKDANECYECYGNGSVSNCRLIFLRANMIGCSS